MANELESLAGLANELSSALADLVLAAQEGQANTGEISTTLAEMLELARAAKDRPPPEPPQVHVTVQPAQLQVLPAPACDFEVTHTFADGTKATSYIRRIAPKE